jgi:hypothetical protein
MREYPKRIKRLLLEYTMEAHERELHRELTKLDQSFDEWRNGTIGSGELSHRIHKWDTGPSRELFKQYNNRPHEMSVAYAIAVGILDEYKVPAELPEAISRPIDFFWSLQERNELQERD